MIHGGGEGGGGVKLGENCHQLFEWPLNYFSFANSQAFCYNDLKRLAKLIPGANFINILWAAFYKRRFQKRKKILMT